MSGNWALTPSRGRAALLALALAGVLRAEPAMVVIVNADSGVDQLTPDQARDLFLGRQKRLAPGLVALPVEQSTPSLVRSRFYRLLAHKDLADISAYWARLCFTGQSRPPRQVSSSEEVIRMVAADKGAVGLLERGKLDHRVRVALVLDPEAGP